MTSRITPTRAQDLLSRVSSYSESIRGTSHLSAATHSLLESADHEDARASSASEKGGPPNMWSRDLIGYYCHYACIGMVNGLLQSCLQPYCQYVVMGQPNQCGTIATFVNLPWSFKILYGLLSDAVPINGQHRKPYMVLGWSLTVAGSLVIAIMSPTQLSVMCVLFLGITFAYIIADCAADAALVGFSASEPPETRGSILATAYLIRFTSGIGASSIIAFLYNGPPTQGDFSFGLTTAQLLWIVVGFVCVLMGASLPFLHEPLDMEPPAALSTRLRQFHELMMMPSAYRIAFAMVGLTTLSLVLNQATNNANAEWFHMTPLQFGLSAALNNVVLAVGMWAFKRFLLNVNWRVSYAVGIVGMQGLAAAYLLTIYDESFRNGWWIVFTSQDSELAYALIFAIGVVIIPEIAMPGYEGITYGAITTYSNCAQNLTNVINNLLLAIWPSNTQSSALRSDTAAVKQHMAYLTYATMGVALASLVFLPVLPSQKEHVARLRALPPSRLMGNLAVLLLILLMVGGSALTCLPIFPATACLVIAGGAGC